MWYNRFYAGKLNEFVHIGWNIIDIRIKFFFCWSFHLKKNLFWFDVLMLSIQYNTQWGYKVVIQHNDKIVWEGGGGWINGLNINRHDSKLEINRMIFLFIGLLATDLFAFANSLLLDFHFGFCVDVKCGNEIHDYFIYQWKWWCEKRALKRLSHSTMMLGQPSYKPAIRKAIRGMLLYNLYSIKLYRRPTPPRSN